MGDWAALRGCAVAVDHDDRVDERSSWDGCADGHEVVLSHRRRRHTGGRRSTAGAELTTQRVHATDEALAFFARHHL